MRVTFFRVAERKSPKKGQTLLSATPSLRYGATWGARSRGAPQNSVRADALRSNNCGESVHEARVSFGTRATPRPARPRRFQKGTRESDIHTGHRCTRPSLRSARRLRPRDGAERSKGPCGCLAVRLLDVRLPNPLLAAPAAGRLWGGTRVGARVLRELNRRGCPSGAAQQQSEFHGAPRNRPAAGLPLRNAKGSQTGGRLSFGYFSLAKQRTSTSPAGASPGSRPEHWHAVATESPGLSKRRPNAPGKTQ
ncbi:hypothetical protein C8C93_3355 [Acidovorax sp. 93]|nr:hypothetical protein C8C93_3355 [Acidovorax sp. 93]